MAIKIVNLETGRPTVAVAITRLNQELAMAKAYHIKSIKIIHGYGSSGKGGAIKKEVQQVLQKKKRSGMIKEFVAGEDFDPFHDAARRILDLDASLKKDSDYCRGNDGITIIVL